MSIPLNQLETWSNQGALTTSSLTYQSLRTALTHDDSPIAGLISSGQVKIDLQGSYAHDTNIYGDSDVDVIVYHTRSFQSNKLDLSSDQYQLHEQTYPVATYGLTELRRDVIAALNLYYGESFIDLTGKKSIKVLPASNRLRLDVVPAITYRKYDFFYSNIRHAKVEGIHFRNLETNEEIINYPKQHYINAVAKHGSTGQKYKKLVRVFKNMRSYLIDKGRLTREEAPSYFIQGMVYNIPDFLFSSDLAETTLAALQWLNQTDPSTFINQNHQHALIGHTSEFWNPENAKKTITELCYLWDHWGEF